MIDSFLKESILKRAQEKGVVEVQLVNIRDYSEDQYRTVDDKPYGGGAGMVMRVDIVAKALSSLGQKPANAKTIITTPKGVPFQQKKAQEYAQLDSLTIIAGHYEGVDERIMEYIDEEVSLGDFVMTGGEVTAAAIIDSVTRLLPGALKKEEAIQIESFYEVEISALKAAVGEDELLNHLEKSGATRIKLLEYPQYTRPENYEGKRVPDILLSGNHAEIERWRLRQSYEETKRRRPDLLEKQSRKW